jgi:hypothetical protein
MMDSEAMRMGNVSNDAEGEKLLVNHRRGVREPFDGCETNLAIHSASHNGRLALPRIMNRKETQCPSGTHPPI